MVCYNLHERLVRRRCYLRSVERRRKVEVECFVDGSKRGSGGLEKKEQRQGVRDRISETAAKLEEMNGQSRIERKTLVIK